MTPRVYALVAKALSKLKGKSISPGEHSLHGRAIVDLDCVIRKGEPTEATPQYKPDWQRVIAYLLFVHTPYDCDQAARALDLSLDAADRQLPLDASYLEHVEGACERFLAQKAHTQKKVPREGATSVVGDVKLIDFTPAKDNETAAAVDSVARGAKGQKRVA
jgi:hypothetical protein